jgi:hypothetical protein
MKGKFKPKNPKKYVGDLTNIVYRSSWEMKCMSDLDNSPSVEAWSSEGMAIPYKDPSKRNPDKSLGKWRHYYPDFIVKKRGEDGKVETLVIEIKPAHEMKPPVTKGKTKRKLLKESATFATNLSKWKACKAFCDKQGWRFMVLNEYDLGLKKR